MFGCLSVAISTFSSASKEPSTPEHAYDEPYGLVKKKKKKKKKGDLQARKPADVPKLDPFQTLQLKVLHTCPALSRPDSKKLTKLHPRLLM